MFSMQPLGVIVVFVSTHLRCPTGATAPGINSVFMLAQELEDVRVVGNKPEADRKEKSIVLLTQH